MTTTTDCLLHDVDSAVDAIDRLTWDDGARPDRIGLEIEAFPIAGGPGYGIRLPLYGAGGVLDIVSCGFDRRNDSHPPIFQMDDGGQVTFEPGGQIELSTSAHTGLSSLIDQIDGSWNALESAFRERSSDLILLGIDPWHSVEEVPQQHPSGRYVAMDAYFAKGWPAGAVMMRNTCSLQINVESGARDTRRERWLAANLLSPILTAMFSTSPGPQGLANRRAGIWQSIDPTRTGYPHWSNLGRIDPAEDVRKRVLGANVMFATRESTVTPFPLGFSFGEWVRSGHPELGRPTIDDLRTHMSTIFTEVRPRSGVLEMRAVDAQLRGWWIVPAVIVAGILYDDQVRSQAIELMSRFVGRLELTWRTAAHAGLKDVELADIAFKLANLALEAARRSDILDRRAISATVEFIDRFTERGLSPADELRPMVSRGTAYSAPSTD